MSYCKDKGKDKIMFITPEDMAVPSKSVLESRENEVEPGPMLPNGEMNWGCPCLNSLAAGPCGVEFRESVECFLKMDKGEVSNCDKTRNAIVECMGRHPEPYRRVGSNKNDTEEELELPSHVALEETAEESNMPSHGQQS